MSRRVLSSLLLAASLALPAAHAQSDQPELPPNLAGLWTFEAKLNRVCQFHGQARLTPTGDPARFGCELTAEQDCPSLDVHYVVEQSCTAVITEDETLRVTSTIETFLQGPPSRNYLPDNFDLEIRTASHLEGLLVGPDIYPAEWRRAEGAIS
ncbi:hypothetical protein [Henriciella aquimarina]|uniref:hypothetical protein n=1 Tax=Henriciella aquimarina TaxID=545261 RepID=UPI000A04AFEF|nr:hypothetical protein [Henriciella aquimarina]